MIRLVLCNCPPEEAPRLARRLVAERLAACVNIVGGVRSIYRWEGQICEEEESTLWIKTTEGGYELLVEKLRDYHCYEVPEIIALEPADVNQSYGEWVDEQVR